ncbi:MAG: hypothetical protein QXF76_02440, partial [Candidatus Anstonellales archaeon]
EMLAFEKFTKIFPRDAIKGENYIIFVIDSHTINNRFNNDSFQKKLRNSLKILSTKFRNNVLYVLLNPDPIATIKSYYDNVHIIKIKPVYENGYCVYVPDDHRGKAIGKGGYRIKALKEVFKKYFNNSHVMIKSISVPVPERVDESNSNSNTNTIKNNEVLEIEANLDIHSNSSSK